VALHNLQDDVGFVPGPAYKATCIATIHVCAFNKGEASPRALQNCFGAIPVLDVGPMHLDREEPSIGVGQDVALATSDLFACVIALRSPF
jgi:hypothetical protein